MEIYDKGCLEVFGQSHCRSLRIVLFVNGITHYSRHYSLSILWYILLHPLYLKVSQILPGIPPPDPSGSFSTLLIPSLPCRFSSSKEMFKTHTWSVFWSPTPRKDEPRVPVLHSPSNRRTSFSFLKSDSRRVGLSQSPSRVSEGDPPTRRSATTYIQLMILPRLWSSGRLLTRRRKSFKKRIK